MKSLKNTVSFITGITSIIGVIVLGLSLGLGIIMLVALIIAILGFISSIFLWKEKRWASWVIFLYFLIQVISIQTATLSYFLWIGFKLYITIGLDGVVVGINIFAVVMAILTLKLIHGQQNKPTQA